MEEDPCELGARLIAAIEAGDTETVKAIYAPNAVIWHSNDRVEQSVDENVRVLQWVTKNVANLRYESIRRTRTWLGFAQQHVLHGVAPNGRELRIPACLMCTVVNGRITRLDEYIDSAHVSPLLEPPG